MDRDRRRKLVAFLTGVDCFINNFKSQAALIGPAGLGGWVWRNGRRLFTPETASIPPYATEEEEAAAFEAAAVLYGVDAEGLRHRLHRSHDFFWVYLLMLAALPWYGAIASSIETWPPLSWVHLVALSSIPAAHALRMAFFNYQLRRRLLCTLRPFASQRAEWLPVRSIA